MKARNVMERYLDLLDRYSPAQYPNRPVSVSILPRSERDWLFEMAQQGAPDEQIEATMKLRKAARQ